MRLIEIEDFEFVSGGLDANACQSAILGATGPGATAGALFGAAVGSVIPLVGSAVGAAVGAGIGTLAAGAYTAATNPNCAPPSSEDGDE